MEIIIYTHFNFLFYQDYLATIYLNESLCLFTNSKESALNIFSSAIGKEVRLLGARDYFILWLSFNKSKPKIGRYKL